MSEINVDGLKKEIEVKKKKLNEFFEKEFKEDDFTVIVSFVRIENNKKLAAGFSLSSLNGNKRFDVVKAVFSNLLTQFKGLFSFYEISVVPLLKSEERIDDLDLKQIS